MRERYDPATKVWTQINAVIIAGIVDLIAVVSRVNHYPSLDPYWWLWGVATAIVVFPAFGWTAGHLVRHDYQGTIMWADPMLLVLCMQLVVLKWAIT